MRKEVGQLYPSEEERKFWIAIPSEDAVGRSKMAHIFAKSKVGDMLVSADFLEENGFAETSLLLRYLSSQSFPELKVASSGYRDQGAVQRQRIEHFRKFTNQEVVS